MSWIIVEKATGRAVLETWSQDLVNRVNLDKYRVLTAYEHLRNFNQQVKAERSKALLSSVADDMRNSLEERA